MVLCTSGTKNMPKPSKTRRLMVLAASARGFPPCFYVDQEKEKKKKWDKKEKAVVFGIVWGVVAFVALDVFFFFFLG